MKFKTLLIGCLLFLCSRQLFAQILVPSQNDSRNTLSLNGTWKFKYFPSTQVGEDSLFYNSSFDVSKWSNIKVPGNWEMQGFAEPVYAKKLKDAVGLYRNNFTVPENWNGSSVYIAFDGVEFGYTVWLNGHYVGEFASAFNRHVFDVSAFVLSGKSNVLAVKVITHPKGWEFDTNDDWSISGISRSVTAFSLPTIHVKDVVVKTFLKKSDAIVNINALIEKRLNEKFSENLKLTGQLTDASGKLVKEFSITAKPSSEKSDELNFFENITVSEPKLWNTETPNLYTLHLVLKDNTTVLQQVTEHVGIREITWTNGILKLNGTPIKLKGATHHDLSPFNGRAITEAEIRKDLELMRKANINFIRTSHYPPNSKLLEFCDSLGFYVDDEVPFGFGEEHLKDSSYLPILLQRAKSTLFRDKNHPSIILWTVGNENPVTDLGLETGRYVKSLDDTRPYSFPQTPTVFKEMIKSMPQNSANIFSPHYLTAPELLEFAKTIDRPLIMTEYAHALGLDFGSMEAIYETMYSNPKLAGGAVWEFFDQGLLVKANKKNISEELKYYAWKNADSVYNTSANEGADGIVYANRTPQTDYWQVRKVYSPVKALDDTLQYKAGKQSFKIKVANRYDFTNLSTVACKWQLLEDTTVLASGLLPLNCKPHDTALALINAVLPEKQTASFYYIKIWFENKEHYQFYEKSYLLQTKNTSSLLQNIVKNNISKPVKTENVVTAENYRFEFSSNSKSVQLKNKDGNILISQGVFSRVGRKTTIAQDATETSKRSKVLHSLWNPFLLSKSETEVKRFDAHQLAVNYKYQPDSFQERSVSGNINYRFTDSGFINVNYGFTPEGKGDATETGISFLIPSTFTEFRWIGKGPYAAYPGKDKLSEFAFYHLNSNDLYFSGNRQNVYCAVFSDAHGAGFALIANDANISVEKTEAGIVVSHNAYVAGRFNKYTWPTDLYSFSDKKEIKGSFSIVPFSAKTWPKQLKDIFGDIKQTAQPFNPFYHSYDQ